MSNDRRDLPPAGDLPMGMWWAGGDLKIDVPTLLAGLGVPPPPPPELVAAVVRAAEDLARRSGCVLEVHE